MNAESQESISLRESLVKHLNDVFIYHVCFRTFAVFLIYIQYNSLSKLGEKSPVVVSRPMRTKCLLAWSAMILAKDFHAHRYFRGLLHLLPDEEERRRARACNGSLLVTCVGIRAVFFRGVVRTFTTLDEFMDLYLHLLMISSLVEIHILYLGGLKDSLGWWSRLTKWAGFHEHGRGMCQEQVSE